MQVAHFTGTILALLNSLVLYLYYKIEKHGSLATRLNVIAWLLYIQLNPFPHQNVMAATRLPIWNSPLSLLSLDLYSGIIDENAICHGPKPCRAAVSKVGGAAQGVQKMIHWSM